MKKLLIVFVLLPGCAENEIRINPSHDLIGNSFKMLTHPDIYQYVIKFTEDSIFAKYQVPVTAINVSSDYLREVKEKVTYQPGSITIAGSNEYQYFMNYDTLYLIDSYFDQSIIYDTAKYLKIRKY